jgi:hypothetical protein
MALVVPPGFGNARFVYTTVGDPDEMGYSLGANLSSYNGDFQTAVDEMRANHATKMGAGYMGSNWTFKGVRLYVGQDGGASAVYESFTDVVGNQVNTTLPQNCAILLHKRTASAGRNMRGRCFIPPYWPPEGSVDATGNIASSALTNMNASWADIANDRAWVLFHDSASPGTKIPTAITQLRVDAVIATMRRRLRR